MPARTLYLLLSVSVLLTACGDGTDTEALPAPAFRYTLIDNESNYDEEATATVFADGALRIVVGGEFSARILLYLPELRTGEHQLDASTYAFGQLRDPRLAPEGYTRSRYERQGFVQIDELDEARQLVSGSFSFIARNSLSGAQLVVKEGRFEHLRLVSAETYFSDGYATVSINGVSTATGHAQLTVRPAYLDATLGLNGPGGSISLHLPAELAAGTHPLHSDYDDLSRPYFRYRTPDFDGFYLVDSLSTITLETIDIPNGRVHGRVNAVLTNTDGDTRPLEVTDLTLHWK